MEWDDLIVGTGRTVDDAHPRLLMAVSLREELRQVRERHRCFPEGPHDRQPSSLGTAGPKVARLAGLSSGAFACPRTCRIRSRLKRDRPLSRPCMTMNGFPENYPAYQGAPAGISRPSREEETALMNHKWTGARDAEDPVRHPARRHGTCKWRWGSVSPQVKG